MSDSERVQPKPTTPAARATGRYERFRVEERPTQPSPRAQGDELGEGEGGRLRPPSTFSTPSPRREPPLAQRLAAAATLDERRPRFDSRSNEHPTVMRERLAAAAERDLARQERYERPKSGRQWHSSGYRPLPSPASAPLELGGSHPAFIVVLVFASLLILWFLWGEQTASVISRYASSADITADLTRLDLAVPRASGNHVLAGPPSISAQQIDAVLAGYGSPATGTGAAFYQLGLEYGIDPAYALAFFIHESSAGTNPAWAGIKPGGATTHNVGNIICAGYPTCYGRFRDYRSWEDGIRDWYRLMRVEYIEGRGLRTVGEMLPIYAPSADNNNPAGYTAAVEQMVDRWRAGEIR
jgi:hypothetical protein